MESEFGTAGSPTVLVNENVRKPEKQLEKKRVLIYCMLVETKSKECYVEVWECNIDQLTSEDFVKWYTSFPPFLR